MKKMRNPNARTGEHAAFFRALGHPIRLGIVEVRYRLRTDVVAGLQQQLDEVIGVPHGPSLPPVGKLRAALEHRPQRRPR